MRYALTAQSGAAVENPEAPLSDPRSPAAVLAVTLWSAFGVVALDLHSGFVPSKLAENFG